MQQCDIPTVCEIGPTRVDIAASGLSSALAALRKRWKRFSFDSIRKY